MLIQFHTRFTLHNLEPYVIGHSCAPRANAKIIMNRSDYGTIILCTYHTKDVIKIHENYTANFVFVYKNFNLLPENKSTYIGTICKVFSPLPRQTKEKLMKYFVC